MPTETINYLRFVYRFPVIAQLWKYLAALTVYSTIIVIYNEHQSPVPGVEPRGKGNEAILAGIVFGWLMSFRNNVAYARWWDGRSLWGQLVNESRNLALKARQFLPDGHTARELGSLITSFAEALKRHLRNSPPWEPGKPPPQPGPHVPMEITAQIYQLLHREKTESRIDGFLFLSIDQHARELMNICGACEKIKNTPMALSYRGLLRKGITGYMLVLPWIMVHDLEWFTVPVMVLTGYALIGLELIAASIENPFGHDGDDLPLDEIVETIRRGVRVVFPEEPAP